MLVEICAHVSASACDVGTAPNQTLNGLPTSSTVNGDPGAGGELSYLPGMYPTFSYQRDRRSCLITTRSTLESLHVRRREPSRSHSLGWHVRRTFGARDRYLRMSFGSPVASVLFMSFQEAQISGGAGQVSQSAQWGPFNNEYIWFNTSSNLIIPNLVNSTLNTYIG